MDELTFGDYALIAGAAAAGFLAVAAVAVAAGWALYRHEVRSIRRNREVSVRANLAYEGDVAGFRRALDRAAERGVEL